MNYTSLSPTTKNGSWATVALVVLGITTTCLIYQHRSSFSIVRNTVFQGTEEEVSTTREHITDEKDSVKTVTTPPLTPTPGQDDPKCQECESPDKATVVLEDGGVKADASTSSPQSFAKQYVHKLLNNVLLMVGNRLARKANLMDIVARATDATTVVFSRDNWFEEVCKSVKEGNNNIAGVSIKCPLTLRLQEEGVCYSLLLNAFVEYDIRLDTNLGVPTSTLTSTGYQNSVMAVLESILVHQYCNSMNNSVKCKITCEFAETPDIAELVGLPLADKVTAHIASRLLMPDHWTFDTEPELCEFVYAQCVDAGEPLSPTMTLDRVQKMLVCDEMEMVDGCERRMVGDAETTPTHQNAPHSLFDQPLAAILCHWASTDTDRLHAQIEKLAKAEAGKCVMHKSSCGLLVPQKRSMDVNNQLHNIGQQLHIPMNTFIVQVQNRATVMHKPRLAHVTMIEVV